MTGTRRGQPSSRAQRRLPRCRLSILGGAGLGGSHRVPCPDKQACLPAAASFPPMRPGGRRPRLRWGWLWKRPGRAAEPPRDESRMMGDSPIDWVGSAYLFVQSRSEKVLLPVLYRNPHQRPSVFRAFKLALADSTGSLHGVDVLKVYCNEPHLIMQLKFSKKENCRRFLQSYCQGALQDSLQKHLKTTLSMASVVPVETELKAGAEKLDSMIREEDWCLECIYHEKPNRLRDEEITKLEESLQLLSCCEERKTDHQCPSSDSPPRSLNSSIPPPNSPVPSLNSSPPSHSSLETPHSLPQADTFTFQGQQFANRRISPQDHQKFAKLISKKWKQVGRTLQANCRALRDPVIDNLAMEYEREGLYEQAYQLLCRFIYSEGKRATIQRLIAALEDNGLISIAEELLGVQESQPNA